MPGLASPDSPGLAVAVAEDFFEKHSHVLRFGCKTVAKKGSLCVPEHSQMKRNWHGFHCIASAAKMAKESNKQSDLSSLTQSQYQ